MSNRNMWRAQVLVQRAFFHFGLTVCLGATTRTADFV